VLNRIIAIHRSVFKRSMEERDRIIKQNILGSLIFQFFTNVLGLLVVPLSLSYIDNEKYGIWLNASVIVTWLQNMNFGMGFGMQNKVAEAMAKGEDNLAKEYVTIVYRYSTLIAIGIFILGAMGSFFINWNRLFNSSVSSAELFSITIIAFLCFLIYFVLGNIIPLFNALKRTSVPKFFGLLTNAVTVVFLYCINKFSHNNLTLVALALAMPTPLIYLFGNVFFFKRDLKLLRPGWKIKEKKHVKDVFNLGMKFFLMQLTTLVITQSGVFIITQYLGPAEVTPYNIVTRYFYFVFFIFALGITPYWSGFTEAYYKKDFKWIKKGMRQLMLAGIAGSVLVLIMLIISFKLIPIWSKHSFDVNQYKVLIYSSAIYTVTLFFSSIIAVFLNGLSLLRLQLIVQLIIAFLTISISILLITQFKLGNAAISITAIIGQIIFIIVCGWQAYKFIKIKSLAHLRHAEQGVPV
jgi:O-antigen/teichoic acid export membrane protein